MTLLSRSAANVAVLALAAPALAQEPLSFGIDSSQVWTWAATSSAGMVVPNPTNAFALTGNARLEISRGAQPIQSAAFVSGGSALVTPDLSAIVPGLFPGLPPLATVDIANLTLEFTSPVFNVAANGSFTTLLTGTVLTGTLTTTTILGSVSVTDLAGTQGNSQLASGTLIQVGSSIEVDLPIFVDISFVDPSSGISGQVDLFGDLVATHTCVAPVNYCSAAPNSTGSPATLIATGSTRIQDQNFGLLSSSLPSGQFAYFLVSRTQGVYISPGTFGILCLDAPIGRFTAQVGQVQVGSFGIPVDLSALPMSPSVAVQPGETWNFQLWYRDVNPTPTSNFSTPLSVVFCP